MAWQEGSEKTPKEKRSFVPVWAKGGTGQEMDLEDLTPPKVVQHHIQVRAETLL